MDVHIAASEEEIAACYPVMRELRPHIAAHDFVARVRSLEPAGYRLAYLRSGEGIVAVAGFRIAENLAWGRFLYVDDLVTLAARRSQGLGRALLDWLRAYAVEHRCGQLHLDSGLQRVDAHRFYEREGMSRAGYHFAEDTAPVKTDRGAAP
jgi:GNAT superfamily N-acetyltransferase